MRLASHHSNIDISYVSCCVTLLLLLILVLCRAAQAQDASFEPLGDLPGGSFNSQAQGVSGDGQIVVGLSASSGPGSGGIVELFKAFRWEEGEMTSLGGLVDEFGASEAWAISRDGTVIVGGAFDGAEQRAFWWTQSGGMVAIGSPGGSATARGVSTDGSTIVGEVTPLDGDSQAFRWRQPTGLDILPSAWSVSADGSVIVGRSGRTGSDTQTRAVRWASGVAQALQPLPGEENQPTAEAWDVSLSGCIAVGRGTPDSATEGPGLPLRWVDNMVEALDIQRGLATGVSADGSVVVGGAGDRAFVWDAIHGLRDLQSVLENDFGLDLTGWTLNLATDVSDDGSTIVGWGDPPDPAIATEAWRVVIPRENGFPDPCCGLGAPIPAGHLLHPIHAGFANDNHNPQITAFGSILHAIWDITGLSETPGSNSEGDLLFAYRPNPLEPFPFTFPNQLNLNAETDVNSDRSGKQAVDDVGNLVTVWESFNDFDTGTDKDILFTRSDLTGNIFDLVNNPKTSPAALNTNAGIDTGSDQRPTVATDGSSNWVALWSSRESSTIEPAPGTDSDIVVSRITTDDLLAGAPWSAPVALNQSMLVDEGTDESPSLATDGVGTWIAVWNSNESFGGVLGSDQDILVSFSGNNGQTWNSPPGRIDLAFPASRSDQGNDFFPEIATDGNGHWVVVWQADKGPPGAVGCNDFDILVSHSDDDGLSWSVPAFLNNNAGLDSGDDVLPHIATNGAGVWVAVWESDDSLANLGGGVDLGTDRDILIAASADGGATWTTPTAIDPDPAGATDATNDVGDDIQARITAMPDDHWTVVWSSDAHDEDFDVLWTTFELGGNTAAGANVVTRIGDATITFDQVTAWGETTISESSVGSPPPRFFREASVPPQYFLVETTAEFTGEIEVCLPCDESMCEERNLALLHGVDGEFVDVTTRVDEENDIVCGRVTSLTEFLLATRFEMVSIDVKPGGELNLIAPKSRGVVPVAVLGSDAFDVAQVDVTTLRFEDATPAHRVGGHSEDVNGDGFTDLVSHYPTPDTGIAVGDKEACVTGELRNGLPMAGCDSILVVGPCGLGFELALLLSGLMWLRRRRRRIAQP
jgi:uncharacterized membrane protein